jgi:RNA polymerase sigma-70 factor (ECF subfamily)
MSGAEKGRLVAFVRPAGALAELEDRALLAVCATRDRAAVGVLFDRYCDDVVAFLSRMLGHGSPDIEDLAQATFLAAVDAAQRFEGGSSVKSWLFGIAANLARTYLRSRRRGREALAQVAAVERPPVRAPDRELEQHQQVALLESGLRTLDPDRRAAFLLFVVEGVPGPEAARQLGVTLGTLWRRVSEARAHLRAVLAKG